MKRLFCACLLSALIVILGIPFFSCREKVIFPSTNISLVMALNKDGSVMQEIDFSLQSERMTEIGVTLKHQLEVRQNFMSAVNSLRNEFYLSFLLIYTLAPNPQFQISSSVAVGDVYYDSASDVIGFKIVYRSIAAYSYFQGATLNSGGGDDKTNAELLGKEVLPKFFERASNTGKFPFAGKYTDKTGNVITVGERYLNIYKNCFNITLGNSICEKLITPSFVYDYATPFANLRSNADIVLSSGGKYHNIWIRDESNFKQAEVILTSTVVYSGWWYLSLLVVIILVLAIITAIIKIKNRVKPLI